MWPKMPTLDWACEPLAESFGAFKAGMILYLENAEVEAPAKQATKIKITTGDKGIRRFMASGLTTAEVKVPECIWQFLEEQLDMLASK